MESDALKGKKLLGWFCEAKAYYNFFGKKVPPKKLKTMFGEKGIVLAPDQPRPPGVCIEVFREITDGVELRSHIADSAEGCVAASSAFEATRGGRNLKIKQVKKKGSPDTVELLTASTADAPCDFWGDIILGDVDMPPPSSSSSDESDTSSEESGSQPRAKPKKKKGKKKKKRKKHKRDKAVVPPPAAGGDPKGVKATGGATGAGPTPKKSKTSGSEWVTAETLKMDVSSFVKKAQSQALVLSLTTKQCEALKVRLQKSLSDEVTASYMSIEPNSATVQALLAELRSFSEDVDAVSDLLASNSKFDAKNTEADILYAAILDLCRACRSLRQKGFTVAESFLKKRALSSYFTALIQEARFRCAVDLLMIVEEPTDKIDIVSITMLDAEARGTFTDMSLLKALNDLSTTKDKPHLFSEFLETLKGVSVHQMTFSSSRFKGDLACLVIASKPFDPATSDVELQAAAETLQLQEGTLKVLLSKGVASAILPGVDTAKVARLKDSDLVAELKHLRKPDAPTSPERISEAWRKYIDDAHAITARGSMRFQTEHAPVLEGIARDIGAILTFAERAWLGEETQHFTKFCDDVLQSCTQVETP